MFAKLLLYCSQMDQTSNELLKKKYSMNMSQLSDRNYDT